MQSTRYNLQVPIYVKSLICSYFELPVSFAGEGAIREWGIKFVTPGGPVRAFVTVIVAVKIVPPRLLTARDSQRLVNRGEEVFG